MAFAWTKGDDRRKIGMFLGKTVNLTMYRVQQIVSSG